MAAPTISGYSLATASGGGSSITIDPTANLTSGSLSNGDWIIVAFSSASNYAGTNVPTAPGDWTVIVPFTGVGSGTTTFGVWAHKRASGENTYTWSQTTSGGNFTYYRSFFVSGADDVSNWVIGSFDYRQNTGTTTTNVAASVTTSTADNLALLLSEERTLATETDPQVTCTNFTKFFFDNTYDHILVAGTKSMPSPGSTGSSTVTYPNAHNYNGIAGILGIPPADNAAGLMWVT